MPLPSFAGKATKNGMDCQLSDILAFMIAKFHFCRNYGGGPYRILSGAAIKGIAILWPKAIRRHHEIG